jgi:cytochrome c5
MSNQDDSYKSSTLGQLILVIPGTILAFTLLISLLAKTLSVVNAPAAEPTQAAVAQVEVNIKPVAEVEIAVANAGPHVDKSGEEVVKAVCSMCHAAGLMNAPKIGDKDAWKPRIAQGYDTLVSHAINGIRSMPAKGGNSALSEGEIANAVAHMANAGGANFTPPAPKVEDAAEPATPAAETPAAAAPAPAVK